MVCRSLALISAGLVSVFLLTSCMEQYNPKPFLSQADKERTQSIQPIEKLTAEGKVPVKVVAAVAGTPGEGSGAHEKYESFCSSCHGAKGMGDGPGAAALNPKPRNFHEKDWQAKVDDARIANVIKRGGAANGLSATMAPWGAVLNDAEVAGLVKIIREFGK